MKRNNEMVELRVYNVYGHKPSEKQKEDRYIGQVGGYSTRDAEQVAVLLFGNYDYYLKETK